MKRTKVHASFVRIRANIIKDNINGVSRKPNNKVEAKQRTNNMRKILFLTLVIICGVAFSDGWAKRPKKNQQKQEDEINAWKENIPLRTGPALHRVFFPCAEEAVSNDEYFATYVEEVGRTMQEAMQRAQIVAIRDIQSKGYSNVSDMQIACQQISQDSNGEYTCYMAVHVPIKKGLDSIKEDDLIILFDSAQRDSLKQILRRKLDSLENAQEITTK